MQQLTMKLGGSLLDMMYVKPWSVQAFRAGASCSEQKHRNYQAAKAAIKSNAKPNGINHRAAQLDKNTPRASRGKVEGGEPGGRS